VLLTAATPSDRATTQPTTLTSAPRTGRGNAILLDTWRPAAEPGLGGVIDPVDVDVATDGSVFIVDRALHRVQRFDADGHPLTSYGRQLSGTAPLSSPLGALIDETHERLFVADHGNQRLVIFDLAGTAVDSWTGFREPEAMTLGLDHRLYTYDRGYNAIVARRADGGEDVVVPVTVATSTFAELPNGLATAKSGNIFFAAEAPVRDMPPVLYEFTPEGETVPHRRQLDWNPRDITFDADGTIFLLDGQGARLIRDFNIDTGRYTSAAIDRHTRALAAGPELNTLSLLTGPTNQGRGGITRVRFDGRTLVELGRWSFPELEPGWFTHPLRLAAGADGRLYLVDELHRAQQLATSGQALASFAQAGLQEATAIAGGDLIVARARSSSSLDDPHDPDVPPPGSRRTWIERYHPETGGRPSLVWSYSLTEALTEPNGTHIVALDVDPFAGHVYALDGRRQRVIVVDLAAGTPLEPWPLPARPGVIGTTDLAVAPDGRLHVLHAGSQRILRLDARGAFESEIDAPATAQRIALGADGSLLAATAMREIRWLSADGREQGGWSLPPPSGDAEPPSDLAVDQAGRLYVTDRAASAVYVFDLQEAATPTVYLPIGYRDGSAPDTGPAQEIAHDKAMTTPNAIAAATAVDCW
jgi:DNA-binding beta-propeller fold protein YncE